MATTNLQYQFYEDILRKNNHQLKQKRETVTNNKEIQKPKILCEIKVKDNA